MGLSPIAQSSDSGLWRADTVPVLCVCIPLICSSNGIERNTSGSAAGCGPRVATTNPNSRKRPAEWSLPPLKPPSTPVA